MMRVPRPSTLFVAAALALAAPVAAHAQFGGLLNKAKEKAAEKAAEKASEKAAPVEPGEQLTTDLLGSVLRGANAADRILADRDKIVTAREAKRKELTDLMDRNQPVHRAYEEANGKILECRNASFSKLNEARDAKAEARLKTLQADPAFMGKMQLVGLKYAKAMADAQQKQDPVALQKVQTDMMKELTGVDIFVDLKADSVATDAQCGKLPEMPAALVAEEKAQKAITAGDDSLRVLEAKAVNVGAQASGLEQVRYLQLKERTLGILKKLTGEAGQMAKFGDEEMDVVKKRQGDLEKVKRAL
jgi:hypothetical protein